MATVIDALWQMTTPTTARATNGVPFQVNLLHPEHGVAWDNHTCRFLGVRVDPTVQRETLIDAYTRVTDLVATYQPHAARPHRLQLYWQLAAALQSSVRTLVDLQVLTQTDLLDSDPRRNTLSELPLGQVLRLTESGTVTVASSESATTRFGAAGGLPCVIVRPEQATWSYLEMVHPLDHHTTEIELSGGALWVRQALFVDFLEKGVILRSRVRGAIVERAHDVQLAHDLYRDWCAAPPPLAT